MGGDRTTAPLLAVRNARKSFGGTEALRGVDFTVDAGEVHVLIGENGAGKSTLMNIMSGVVADYEGGMELAGVPVRFSSPHAAQKAGIATVFQELDLVPGLSVADNLFLGHEPSRRGLFLDNVAMRRSATPLLERVGGHICPRATVSDLSLGQQQIVAIAKALAADAKILILDEPTAALSTHEVELLFTVVRRLRADGVGIVYISHRLDEIARIGDRVTVMRDGAIVASVPADTPPADLGPMLTGRPPGEMFPPRQRVVGEPRLRLASFSYRPTHPTPDWRAPEEVTLTVRAGEIVGLVGLLGAGRTELLQTLYGVAPPGRQSGLIEMDGAALRSLSVRSALRRGIGFVPDDRRGSGLIPTLDVASNLALTSLSSLSTGGVVRRSRLHNAVALAVKRFGIRASSLTAAVMSLSGGNQQKVLIGRTLLRAPKLLLLDEPTRGIDVGAKADIYAIIRSLTHQGLAVLVASSELPELTGWCDRLVVLRDGRVVADLDADSDPDLIASLSQHTHAEESS